MNAVTERHLERPDIGCGAELQLHCILPGVTPGRKIIKIRYNVLKLLKEDKRKKFLKTNYNIIMTKAM
jgi:hypothetical protein